MEGRKGEGRDGRGSLKVGEGVGRERGKEEERRREGRRMRGGVGGCVRLISSTGKVMHV